MASLGVLQARIHAWFRAPDPHAGKQFTQDYSSPCCVQSQCWLCMPSGMLHFSLTFGESWSSSEPVSTGCQPNISLTTYAASSLHLPHVLCCPIHLNCRYWCRHHQRPCHFPITMFMQNRSRTSLALLWPRDWNFRTTFNVMLKLTSCHKLRGGTVATCGVPLTPPSSTGSRHP